MKYTLRTKLMISYALLAVLLVASVSLISNVFLKKQFGQYMILQQETKNQELVNQLAQQYQRGAWNKATIENIGIGALDRGMIVKVYDSSKAAIWDATVHNNGLCEQMISDMASNMLNHDTGFRGGYEEKGYPIVVNGEPIGTITIGYYGPFYYSDNDEAFLHALNSILVVVGIVALLIALLVGVFMAKRLSDPISQVIFVAQKIAKGNYLNRIGKTSNTLEIHQLISAINHLATELQNQETLRKRLTSDVAHELRTPLATLQSHLEALIDGVWEPDKEKLIGCHEEILRLGRLVGNLEKLAKLEGEGTTLVKTRFDIKELVLKTVERFRAEFEAKQVEVEVHGEPQQIFADSDKISQVFINLLSNAFKYTEAGGKVKVSLIRQKKAVEIKVCDNGIGISEEDLPHIFERFYRADRSRNRLSGGSGIGLTIAKSIVELHGGELTAQSDKGKGSCFTVVLPDQIGISIIK